MSINFACESCGKTFTVNDRFAGKKGKCKQCGATMEIPGAAPSRPAPSSPPASRVVDRGVAPSRKTAAPPPPQADIFGLDELPTSRRLATSVHVEDDDEPLPPRAGRRQDEDFAPPSKAKKKKKKRSGEEPGLMVFGRILLGLAIGSAGTYGSAMMLMKGLPNLSLPGVSSKTNLENILKQRLTLNQELVALLSNVNDVPSAQAASAPVNAKVRAISANLRTLKTTKVLKNDLESLGQQYTPQLDASTKRWVQEYIRVASIPGAMDALNAQGAIEELDREEKSVPGMRQIDMSNMQIPGQPNMMPGPPNMPPNMRPNMGQNMQPNMGPNMPNPGMPTPGMPPRFGPRPGMPRPGMPRPGMGPRARPGMNPGQPGGNPAAAPAPAAPPKMLAPIPDSLFGPNGPG